MLNIKDDAFKLFPYLIIECMLLSEQCRRVCVCVTVCDACGAVGHIKRQCPTQSTTHAEGPCLLFAAL